MILRNFEMKVLPALCQKDFASYRWLPNDPYALPRAESSHHTAPKHWLRHLSPHEGANDKHLYTCPAGKFHRPWGTTLVVDNSKEWEQICQFGLSLKQASAKKKKTPAHESREFVSRFLNDWRTIKKTNLLYILRLQETFPDPKNWLVFFCFCFAGPKSAMTLTQTLTNSKIIRTFKRHFLHLHPPLLDLPSPPPRYATQ